jgi:DNA invertase Pin-like site-specific DNA recombinase
MRADAHQKVSAGHLKRNAYLYVRQSTIRQVFENTESTKRQYALRQEAAALGWQTEQIIVIDSDLGQSGASAVDREGFQQLVAEVGMGKAGIVLGLEVSRLARNSTDWHRLLEICALTDTLILDEDGVYDPAHFNDRLLLGLKGTMSEAELHVIKARLQGGILNKARRGELQCSLPVGLVYNAVNQPVIDPDKQVQESIRFFFETFQRTGSATATIKAFGKQGLLFPRRLKKGPRKGDLLWAELTHSRALQVLHNPRYAGAFVYGRRRTRKQANGRDTFVKCAREQWILVPGMHAGYISWEQYEEHQRQLRENAQAHGRDRRKSPPREGPALLQGLVLCGICGHRMSVRYHHRGTRPVPDYVCQKDGIEHGRPCCQSVNGELLDKTISDLLVEVMTPMALDVALGVQREIKARIEEVDRLRRKQVERARYEADLAQRRYLHVDPANRLVADSLEAEWNSKLRALNEAQEEYEWLRRTDHLAMDEAQRERIAALASDFPRVWQNPETPDRDKKRMIRLMLEDVTLVKRDQLTVNVRFKGGATKSFTLPLPLAAPLLRKTDAMVVSEVDRLLDHHTEAEIAAILNQKGLRSGTGQPFNPMMVLNIRRNYHLANRFIRLRSQNMLTIDEMAARFGIAPCVVKNWRDKGLLQGHRYNDKEQCLYEPPADNLPGKFKKKRPYMLAKASMGAPAKGVQYET